MPLDPRIDGWYQASSNHATFAFRVADGEVVECAPYGRKMIMGLRWGTAVPVLERGGFTIERLAEPAERTGEPVAANPERAMRFGYLLSEIEVEARRILDGASSDVLATLLAIGLLLQEAQKIAAEVSREALDQVTRKERDA